MRGMVSCGAFIAWAAKRGDAVISNIVPTPAIEMAIIEQRPRTRPVFSGSMERNSATYFVTV